MSIHMVTITYNDMTRINSLHFRSNTLGMQFGAMKKITLYIIPSKKKSTSSAVCNPQPTVDYPDSLLFSGMKLTKEYCILACRMQNLKEKEEYSNIVIFFSTFQMNIMIYIENKNLGFLS